MIDRTKLFKDIELILLHPVGKRVLYHRVEEAKITLGEELEFLDGVKKIADKKRKPSSPDLIVFELTWNGEEWKCSFEDVPQYIIDTVLELSKEQNSVWNRIISIPAGKCKISFMMNDGGHISGSYKMLEEDKRDAAEEPFEKITDKVAAELLEIVDFCADNPEFRQLILKKIGLKWNRMFDGKVSAR